MFTGGWVECDVLAWFLICKSFWINEEVGKFFPVVPDANFLIFEDPLISFNSDSFSLLANGLLEVRLLVVAPKAVLNASIFVLTLWKC